MTIRQIKAGTTTAALKRVYIDCYDVLDGVTPETGEAGGQPQISVDGGAWTDTGIGVLVSVGNGGYYADLTDGAVAAGQEGKTIRTRYKSANTTESRGDTIHVVTFDPHTGARPMGEAATFNTSTEMDDLKVLALQGMAMLTGSTNTKTSSTTWTTTINGANGLPAVSFNVVQDGDTLTVEAGT